MNYNKARSYFCPNPLKLKNPLGLFPAFPLVEDPEGGGKNERPCGAALPAGSEEGEAPPKLTLGAG